MKRLSRDTWLTLGLLSVLIIFASIGAVQQARSQRLPSFTSYSSAPDGVRALNLWLDQLDYDVRNITYVDFHLPAEVDLVFIIEPTSRLSDEDFEILDEWVENGGVLVLAGNRTNMLFAGEYYDFELNLFNAVVYDLPEQNPLFQSPPARATATGPTIAYWESDREDFVTHLARGSRPVVVSFEQGAGRVFLSASPYLFSNAGLKEDGNPEVVLNIISAASTGDRVWFDEWHHGIRAESTEINGPFDWLRYNPIGQSILYVVGILFLAVVLNGRHFGRPKLLLHEINRRTPLEYITAIANLNRRARHRENTLAQYKHWLKRDLGRRYRLDPTIDDESYVKQMSGYRPDLDQEELLGLLHTLSGKTHTEEEMVKAAVDVSKWLNNVQ